MEIISRATRVLANLTTIDYLQQEASRMGFLPKLIGSLKVHVQNPSIAQNVCAAVTNISYNGKWSVVPVAYV